MTYRRVIAKQKYLVAVIKNTLPLLCTQNIKKSFHSYKRLHVNGRYKFVDLQKYCKQSFTITFLDEFSIQYQLTEIK